MVRNGKREDWETYWRTRDYMWDRYHVGRTTEARIVRWVERKNRNAGRHRYYAAVRLRGLYPVGTERYH